jgi:hypothetical protein
MKLITAVRLRAMSNNEKEKRLDELNQKHGMTQPNYGYLFSKQGSCDDQGLNFPPHTRDL